MGSSESCVTPTYQTHPGGRTSISVSTVGQKTANGGNHTNTIEERLISKLPGAQRHSTSAPVKAGSHWRSGPPSEQLVFLTTVRTAVWTTSVTSP